MTALERVVVSEEAMQALGGDCARSLGSARLVYLEGPLGAGKTSFVRGMLRALGHRGAVKSPTFTLVEPYSFNGVNVFHVDLYRLESPQELEFLGLRDYLQGRNVAVIEWAERARSALPEPDIDVMIAYHPSGRIVKFEAHTEPGRKVVACLSVERL